MKGHETLERVKLICYEKADQFQSLSVVENWVPDQSIRQVLALAVWHLFFDFQIELMKAEAEEVPAPDHVVDEQFNSKFPPKPDIDPMEAAAIDAGYIKDVRDKPERKVRVTSHYFYPQDISQAQEGDIWHDLDGRPHFCLGDGWIEARGFCPKVDKDHAHEVRSVDDRYAVFWNVADRDKKPHVARKYPNLISKFKLA